MKDIGKDIYIVGLPSIHTPSWTLIKNGEILIHIEEQKLSRLKNQFGFFIDGELSVYRGWDYCLNAFNLTPSDISYIAFGFNPMALSLTKRSNHVLYKPRHERVFQQQALLLKYIREVKLCNAEVVYVTHHFAHASSAYFTSKFKDSIIITADGWGEDQTFGIFIGRNNLIKQTSAEFMPNSLGEVYTELTKYLGWKEDEEGKTMALSSFGLPNEDNLSLIGVSYSSDRITINTTKFHSFIESISPRKEDIFSKFNVDFTASIQLQLENCLLKIAKWALKKYGVKNLCLAGGLFLNSKINYKLLVKSGFEQIWIQPACGDSGISLGAGLYVNHVITKKTKRFYFTPYLGREYSDGEIQSAINNSKLNFEIISESDAPQKIATLLATGSIIGLFKGKSELGPRSLGNRSIIADPRNVNNIKKINSVIKNREGFRPFAPCVLKEKSHVFFKLPGESQFMLFISEVILTNAPKIPAVVHIDCTSRVQTITKKQNPFLYSLIKAFDNITKVPMILNTSFNLSSEPVVESPHDAINTFKKSKLDYLLIGNCLISR